MAFYLVESEDGIPMLIADVEEPIHAWNLTRSGMRQVRSERWAMPYRVREPDADEIVWFLENSIIHGGKRSCVSMRAPKGYRKPKGMHLRIKAFLDTQGTAPASI